MEFTGERYLPGLDHPEISYAHWHRYLFAKQFADRKTVLDIACGEGYGCNLLAETAESVVGIDRDTETIALAQKTYGRRGNLMFVSGLANPIPLRENLLFDLVISFDTIEHLPAEEQESFLDALKDRTGSGGILIISTPNRKYCGDIPQFRNEFHTREFYQDEFRELLTRRFRNIRILGQNLYAGSQIWDPEMPSSKPEKCYLDLTENGYRPSGSEGLYALYLLAVCSDAEIPGFHPSVLTDVSQRIFWERIRESIRELRASGRGSLRSLVKTVRGYFRIYHSD